MPVSWIYEKIINARNLLYDRGIFKSFDLGARTISIGNVTAGGTGKTPLTAYVAETLADRGERVCILTRGYGRKDPKVRVLVSDDENILADPQNAGDEPFELAQKLLGKAIVVADADRISAAEWAKRKFGVTVFVLDDGFQHRKANRDIDIVCIDATDPFGCEKVLPAGRLREPMAGLKRADIIVITRTNLISEISNLRSEISKINAHAAIFEATTKIVCVDALEEFHAKLSRTHIQDGSISRVTQHLKEQAAMPFCGIGNPASFLKQLHADDFTITANKTFRDHHEYSQKDINEIEDVARAKGASILLTTAKDAVKLRYLRFEIPCFVVEIESEVADAKKFASML